MESRPEGWYGDPSGLVRWWNGHRWTNHTLEVPLQSVPSYLVHERPPNVEDRFGASVQAIKAHSLPERFETTPRKPDLSSNWKGYGLVAAIACVFFAPDPLLGWFVWLPALLINWSLVTIAFREKRRLGFVWVSLSLTAFYMLVWAVLLFDEFLSLGIR